MSKIDLNNVAGGFNLSKINNNFQKIEDALNNGALWRDNPLGEPNQMKNDLDMNGNRIYNLPAPVAENEPARYKEIKDVQVAIDQAHLDAQRAKDEADRAKYEADRAAAAAGSTDASNLKIFNTKAEAGASAPTLPNGQVVEIEADETRNGRRTRYEVQAGVLVFSFYVEKNVYLDDYANLTDAVAAAKIANLGVVHLPKSTAISVNSSVDMQGIGLVGSNTTINNTTNLHNIGPITGCIIRGFPTDVDYITPVFSSGLHKKLIYREASNVLGIFVKRRGRGYVRFHHRYNSFASGEFDTGGSCDNWRSTAVSLMSEVFVYRHTENSKSGTWGASTNIAISASFPPGTATAKQLQYKGGASAGATIDFVVNAKKSGQRGVAAIFCTSGSTTSAEMLVNGVVVRTFNPVGPNVIRELTYELPQSGDNTVTLRNVAGGGSNLYVIGVEFSRLSDVTVETPDAVAWGDYGENYLTGTGANDYALLSTATGKYFGSYHGGETQLVTPEFIVDGINAPIPALDTFLLGDQIYLRQGTGIADGVGSFLQVNSLYRYFEDGVQHFDVCMKGSATVDIAYTCMSITDSRFTQVIFPTYIDNVAVGKNLLGRYNVVKQINRINPSHPLTLTTAFTLFPMGGPSGANMGGNGAFISGAAGSGSNNKLYYGPAIDSTTTIKSLAYNTTRIFE